MPGSDAANPLRELVHGRVAIYFERAVAEHGAGKIRGAYDYAMMALNATLFELKPSGESLFAKLDSLVGSGQLDKQVLELARERDFLCKHERGITDMDLTYMSIEDLQELFGFLEAFYRSLAAHGVELANDPRGQ